VSSVINPLLNYLANSGYNEFGKLFVIINRGTFSSALLNAITLNQEYNSILLGEATGGKPNHYGEISSFILPNSEMMSTPVYFFRISPV
jgi:C-terminal processing protease CtpA/Prc